MIDSPSSRSFIAGTAVIVDSVNGFMAGAFILNFMLSAVIGLLFLYILAV